MAFQYKNDAQVFNQDVDLRLMLNTLTAAQDKASREGGWEFCSMSAMLTPPAIEGPGSVGLLTWILTYARPIDPLDPRCTEHEPAKLTRVK